jgi:hypothetical protein
MKRRSFPLWLLRDLPALIGIAWSFWPLVIMVISNGRRAMSGKKISPRAFDFIMQMLPIAEARLHYALCRQAWRALGWNVRDVQLEILPPITTWSDVAARFEVYRADMMDLHAAATRFTEGLRQHYRIRTRVDANTVRAAHGSTGALRAAHHEAVGVSPRSNCCVALILSSDRRERPSKDEGVLANARGPPPTRYSLFPTPHTPQRPARLRSLAFVRTRTPRRKTKPPALSGRRLQCRTRGDQLSTASLAPPSFSAMRARLPVRPRR